MDISVELPDINSIILTGRDHHSVIGWVEHSLHDGVSVTNESLEVVWYWFLSIIIPYLDEVIISTGEHESTIKGKICRGDCTFVDWLKLTDKGCFEGVKTVDSDALIFGDDDQLSIILSELETTNDVADVDLVLQGDHVGAVDHDIVTAFTDYAEQRIDCEVLHIVLSSLNLIFAHIGLWGRNLGDLTYYWSRERDMYEFRTDFQVENFGG